MVFKFSKFLFKENNLSYDFIKQKINYGSLASRQTKSGKSVHKLEYSKGKPIQDVAKIDVLKSIFGIFETFVDHKLLKSWYEDEYKSLFSFLDQMIESLDGQTSKVYEFFEKSESSPEVDFVVDKGDMSFLHGFLNYFTQHKNQAITPLLSGIPQSFILPKPP